MDASWPEEVSDFQSVSVIYSFFTSMLSSQDCRLATASSPKARFQITIYKALSVKKHWFTVDILAGPPMSHTLKDTKSTCNHSRNKGITSHWHIAQYSYFFFNQGILGPIIMFLKSNNGYFVLLWSQFEIKFDPIYFTIIFLFSFKKKNAVWTLWGWVNK